MRRLQVRFLGHLVEVRFARTVDDAVRLWDVIYPGQAHDRTGLSYAALWRLGEGIHPVRV